MGKFINPFSDWGFKRIFGQEPDKDILLEFLNALFAGEKKFVNLTFCDKEQIPGEQNMRTLIYDVFCITDQGERIIVEMQNGTQSDFIERTMVYMANAISPQMKRGEVKFEFNAVYGIFFMNFKSYGLEPKFRSDFLLADKDTHRVLTPKMRMVYLQLPYFNKEEDECETIFDKFIYIFKNMEILNRMPFAAQHAVFQKLYKIASESALTDAERERYENSLNILRDNIALFSGAREEGMRVGREEGMAEGMAKGIAKEREKTRTAIIKLLNMGMPEEQVAAAYDITVAQLKDLIGTTPFQA